MMWKLLLFLTCILLALFLTGCGSNKDEKIASKLENYSIQKSKAEVKEDDFIYRLVSEKEEYTDGESVKIFAELEYIGDQEEITIYHAASPFYFPMEEKIRGYEISYPMEEPLVSTTLVKGKPLREEYKGSGFYSQEDDKAFVEFMKDFIEKGFPAGYYIINGSADFMIEHNPNEEMEKLLLKTQIDIKVNDTDS